MKNCCLFIALLTHCVETVHRNDLQPTMGHVQQGTTSAIVLNALPRLIDS